MRFFGFTTNEPLKYSVCGQLVNKNGFLHHRRTFDCHVFILVMEGTLHITSAGKEYDVNPNEYIFLKAGEEHFGTKPSNGKLSYFWVHILQDFSFEILNEQQLLFPEIKHFSYFFPEYNEIPAFQRTQRFFRQMLELSLEAELYSTEILNYTLSLLLMEVTQQFVNSYYPNTLQTNSDNKKLRHASTVHVVASVCEWIRINYCRPFKVTDLAEIFGYQANYLSSVFKSNMGISIIEYTNKIRIEAAKNLLGTYHLPTKEVAYSCGFSDEKYFMKVFKALEGKTPTEYKNYFI